MAAFTLILGLLTAVIIYAYFKMFYRKLRPGDPPLVQGHFLWGNAKQFKEQAVKFLRDTRKKYGDVFTVRFLNTHITMILDIHSYETFAREKNFSFRPIEKQVTEKVFQCNCVGSKKFTGKVAQTMNGENLFTYLENFTKHLSRAVQTTATEAGQTENTKAVKNIKYNNMSENCLPENKRRDAKFSLDLQNLLQQTRTLEDAPIGGKWRQDNLRNFVSKTFFSPLFYTIFGRGEGGREGNFHPQVVQKNFDKFHEYFNFLWLGFPIQMFPEAVKALGVLTQQPSSSDMVLRVGCSEYIKFTTQFLLGKGETARTIACRNLEYLHINYNAYRAAYWIAYKLMEEAVVMAAVKKEVDEVIQAKRAGTDVSDCEAEFTPEDINKMPVVDSFLKEVIRVYSGVFVVRKCLADTRFTTAGGQTFNIRKGDKVAIYPPVFHHDPEIYADPEVFKYDRFIDAVFYKNGIKVKHPLIGFGSLCLGQKFSMLQLKWFIINMVNSFKLELAEGEKSAPDKTKYGNEILPPTRDVLCRFMPREGACALKYTNNYDSNGSKGLDGISSGCLV